MQHDLEIIYDHYKDSNALIKSLERSRNRYFVLNSLILAFLIIITIQPIASIETFTSIIKQKAEINFSIEFGHIQSFVWLCQLYIITRYYQISLQIERQYSYVHIIENEISLKTSFTFSREGESYNKSYPMLIQIIYIFYTFIFPAIIFIVIIIKLDSESSDGFSNIIFDAIIASLSMFMISAYTLSRLNKKLISLIRKFLRIKR